MRLVAPCALLIGALLLPHVACEDAYEGPCHVALERVLLEDRALASRSAFSLVADGRRAIAIWLRREETEGSALPHAVVAVEVAIVAEDGGLVRRDTVTAPESLRSRRGGVPSIGVVPLGEPGSYLVHWTETTTATDPDGRQRSGASLRAVQVGPGVAAPVGLPGVTCDRCTLDAALVATGSDVLAFVRIDRARADDSAESLVAPELRVVRVSTGGTASAEDAAWLTLPPGPPPPGGTLRPELSAYVDPDGAVVVRASDRAWHVDAAARPLALRRGPVLLPAPLDARIRWTEDGEAAVAWSTSPVDEGRTANELAPREVFTARVAAGSAGVTLRERATRGRFVHAFDRVGEEGGIVFESAGRVLFSLLAGGGQKRGGDLLVGAAAAPGDEREIGVPPIAEEHVLHARGGGRFALATLGGGRLVTQEIVCAP